jgi:hypothetical protein
MSNATAPGYDEELRNSVFFERGLHATSHLRRGPEERAAEFAARTLALPDAQSVEDLTGLPTSAGKR